MKYTAALKAVALACGLSASMVNAATMNFDQVGDTGSMNFSYTELTSATLLAKIDFTLASITSSTAVFDVTVANNSFGAGQNSLMAFSIDVISPSLTSASDTSSRWNTTLNTGFAGFQQVDLCVWAGDSCPSGAISAGLAKGFTSTFKMTLNTAGNFLSNGVSFQSPYTIKFQGVGSGGGSIEFQAQTGTPPIEIPEPSSIALTGLMLLGLAGAGLAKRKSA